jgi:hypothetical protein
MRGQPPSTDVAAATGAAEGFTPGWVFAVGEVGAGAAAGFAGG